jgi:Tfp pilus assembly protein PilX
MSIRTRIRPAAAREDGFTMIVAIMVLFVSSLFVAAVFVGASGDVSLTRANTNQKDAYYAAMAGISAYKYQLNANTTYWEKCPEIPNGKVPGSTEAGVTEETYKVKTLPASSWEKEGHSTCKSEDQNSIIETSGTASGTFRIESTGIAAKGTKDEVKRSLVATFTHPGYLNYVYLSNFEEADPETRGKSEAECEYYHPEREKREKEHLVEKEACISFPWIAADKVEGPFHTNDEADISGSPVFGRSGHNDAIEMNKGYYGGTPEFKGDGYTTKGLTLLPPEVAATELLSEAGLKYAGRTIIVLEGNTMTVTSNGVTETAVPFPTNGVIAVENASTGCPSPSYKALETFYPKEKEQESSCGNVFIKGKYTQSLTVIAQNDVVIVGNLTTEGGETGGAPTGNAALGLIAIGHARLYHPIKECEALVTHEEKAETEAGVTEGSKVLKNVSSTSGISVGSEISGTKIKSGSTVTSIANLATKGEITISNAAEETEAEVEVTEGSAVLKKVPPTSGISVGSEISGTKIPSGSTVTSIAKLSSGEITISEKIEGTKGKSSKEKIKIKGQTAQEKVEITTKTKVKEVVECKNEEKEGGAVTCNSGGNATATEKPAQEFGESLKNPIIDAAILSTKHSWGVDNYSCPDGSGGVLGNITIWGSIAENFRGRVTCCGGANEGIYIKNYKYDERLKTIQPPNFLAPSSIEVTLSRVTAPPNGFGEG